MGSVELLFPEEGIDLLRGEDLAKPALKDLLIGHRPVGGLHFTAGTKAGNFVHTQVNIGMALLVGDLHDRLETR